MPKLEKTSDPFLASFFAFRDGVKWTCDNTGLPDTITDPHNLTVTFAYLDTQGRKLTKDYGELRGFSEPLRQETAQPVFLSPDAMPLMLSRTPVKSSAQGSALARRRFKRTNWT